MKSLNEDANILMEGFWWETELETILWGILGPTNGRTPAGMVSDAEVLKKAFAMMRIIPPDPAQMGKGQGILNTVRMELTAVY